METPLITVLMSVYNTDDAFLKEAIQSILKQSLRDFEFLIFDDGSVESNKATLKEFAESDSRIRIIENPTNIGLTANLARGVEMSRGKYICRQDADDISAENRFEAQYQYMEAHPDIAVLASNFTVKEGEKLVSPPLVSGEKEVRTRLLFENCIMHSSVMIRNAFLRQHGLNYDTAVLKSQDYDLWTRVLKDGKVDILQERLCTLRKHEGQITQKSSSSQKQFFLDAAVRYLESVGVKFASDADKESHKRFLSVSTGNYSDTKNWARQLLQQQLDPERYDVCYYKKFIKDRMTRITVKKVLGK